MTRERNVREQILRGAMEIGKAKGIPMPQNFTYAVKQEDEFRPVEIQAVTLDEADAEIKRRYPGCLFYLEGFRS